MKDYEIARQGSRFVVKAHEGNVSAPFHTHAAAQEYIDHRRTEAENLAHDGRNQSDKSTTNAQGYDAGENKFGFTVYEGNQYMLTEVPSFSGVYGLGISADNYSAACIDTNGKKYTAFFEILEKGADNSILADWDNASLVERSQ
jgi:hypothetical protein